MSIPRIVYRITNHRKPLYQLYQPGFNDSNSCWIEGGWFSLPKKEWEARKKQHQKEYGDVADLCKNQDHNDDGTPPEKMTPKQRKSWEFHSGSGVIEAVTPSGYKTPVGVSFRAGKIDLSSQKWLEKKGWKITDLRGYELEAKIVGNA